MNARASFVVVAGLLAAACNGAPAKTPSSGGAFNASTFAAAFREEATGDPARATDLYVQAIRVAAPEAQGGWALAGLVASLDALVHRDVGAFAEFSPETALAFRAGNDANVDAQLRDALGRAGGPFARGMIARSLAVLAEHRGDAAAAETWRAASGCAREAMVTGPVSWAPVTGVHDPDALDAFDAKLDSGYAAPGPFALRRAPVLVAGRACAIELNAAAAGTGVRDVVVDADLDQAQTIGVALRAHGAATLRVGGALAVDRPYELGNDDATQLAAVDVPAGRVRIVARVGVTEDNDAVEIDVWDADGKPLALHAPKMGDAGAVKATRVTPIATPAPKTNDELLLAATSALARGDAHSAERMLSSVPANGAATPELLLAYARAVEHALDLSPVQRAERARAAYERVLDAWPSSWEATLAHAVLASVRRGRSEARIEALRDLDQHRAKAQPATAPLLDLFDAATSGREGLLDRARSALARVVDSPRASSLYADVARVVEPKVGAERVAAACDEAPPNRRSDLACFDALRASGDRKRAAAELSRLRTVLGAPNRYLALELRQAASAGDVAGARAIFDRMVPGEQTLVALHATARDLGDSPETRATLRRIALAAKDAPGGIPPLLRSMGDEPSADFAGVAEAITAEDRKSPILPNAATAVLVHDERYAIDVTGLMRHVMLDVRRVSGTTDVEQNAQADAADIGGRVAMRIVRRRIFKKDGRIVEPEETPRASQAHADLAQLEQGDYVEAIYEAWALPGDTGDLTIDTPDLLADRTGVHDARVELRVPKALKIAIASHPMLGAAVETASGDDRVLRWSLKDKPARRLEDGVPRMDRTVGVSASTLEWPRAARALREQVATLDEHDPEIAAWAKDAAAGQKPGSRALVAAIVDAAGKAVREAQGMVVTDAAGGRVSGPQTMTARTILTEHEGSRTWLILRALRELGVAADLVVAEDVPFSANPAFPPHFGRFTHPLVVAHAGAEDVWIDADIAGPPLPAGHLSPELRGRGLLKVDGTIASVPAAENAADSDRDEVDLRLAVDASGNAKGSFTIMLRGRDAQELAEALFRIVGADRQRALRGVVLGWVPYANVDDVVLSTTEGSWQVGVRAEISVSGYAQAQGDEKRKSWSLPGLDPLHYVFPRPYVSALSAVYASQAARESALAVNASIQYHAHRRVELPSGASLARMPMPFETQSPHLTASRKIAVNANVVEDDFALTLPTGTVPQAEYGRFVEDAHKTDDSFLAGTWVKP